jgi:hypothetical protein
MRAREIYSADYVRHGDHAPVPAIEGSADEVFGANSIAYFPTYERPLYYKGRDGAEYSVDDKKAIVRMVDDEPKVLGVVGKNYKVISMEDTCNAVEEEFREALTDDELSVVQRRDRVAYYGATCIRDYVFPRVRSKHINDRSDVAFRTIIVNGFDGSSSFRLYSGAIDFFCENRLVTGSFDMTVQRHTKGFSIPYMAERVRANIDIFYKQSEQWAGWANKTITDEAARECYESIPGISERRVEQLLRQFHIECSAHGRTVWAMYSAATFFASQTKGEFGVRDTGRDHTEATLMNRENQIQKWTTTNEFLKVAA